MLRFARRAFLALSVGLVFAPVMARAEDASAAKAAQAGAGDVTVFAAASLKGSLDEAAKAWTASSGKKVVISYAASSALMKQIEQGAPADAFASADLDWMKYGVDKKLIKPDSVVKLLGNALVLIAPADAATTIELKPGVDLAGAIGEGRIAVGEVKTVPAGKYARAAFEKLGILKAVEPKFAQTDNVRAALALVARGEAKFGVVYATDAAADPKVKVVATFPEDSHEPIVYPFGLTASSNNADAAGFLGYLKTADGQKPFAKAGFTLLKE
ncbi:molybdate ABC transporter substrate-binding protein [Labrys sp. ZIDIC5]|uniref:molybdate ABC transporter substrate-binding protein n=1 Tax=Labrys sedimenti TaxID=3106036 RepID=UPI002ACA25E3|nr:molybdate ABC transporter substrate-binding protein [Labrys sp. ZIDIC5]MDZ5450536.1 molybdate ABC transporter substrate-binding protein [Labrys sp. ZIDIC5]